MKSELAQRNECAKSEKKETSLALIRIVFDVICASGNRTINRFEIAHCHQI